MNNKKLILFVVIIIGFGIYFLLYHKDKKLKYIPENADVVLLIDVKNLSRQYIYSLAENPSQWIKKKDKKLISLKGSGLKIPDFVQIFHLKYSKFSHWYSVLEIKDKERFTSFLKNKKFVNKGKNNFQNDQFFIKIEGDHCILGTSNAAFPQINKELLAQSANISFKADQFIKNEIGSISFISGKNITNFSIELNDDDIEIKNSSNAEDLSSIISKIEKNGQFLEIELDEKNIRNIASFFNKASRDSSQINYFKASANLQLVNDTIITYDYDDDFNEIEKIAVQKIVQPNYAISLQSRSPIKTWEYFQKKKWINAQDQFTVIPFQPNIISRNSRRITIASSKNPLELAHDLKENYIFIKNDPLLLKSFSTFIKMDKKSFSTIDFIFYGNKAQDHYLKLKIKKEKLPLILR